MDVNYKICIQCFTFNHASYIKDAMNGFCMQQTSFPFVCIIIDDASTDGEQEMIHNYLQEQFDLEDKSIVRNEETDDYILSFARHKSNHNCYFAVYFLKYNHYSIGKTKEPYIKEWRPLIKYYALCEGDDYWINSNKLQMQVDFLDSHIDYSMCFHDVNIKAEKGRKWYDVFGKLEDRDYTGFENMLKWSVPTCSIVYKAGLWKDYPQNSKFTMGDNVLILQCSRYGKIRCIPKKMGVYRLTPTSWIGGQSDKVQRYKYISHYKGLIEEFEECRNPQMYAILENQYFQLLTILKRERNIEEFVRIKKEYLNYPGITHWNSFNKYYLKSSIRYYTIKLLGKKLTSFIKKIKHL